MKIATWNVNSIKVRLPNLLRWLGDFQPDVVLLQELKCVAEAFPESEVGDAGYNVAVAGQKTYNGVAILSKSPIDVELTELPGDASDEQARYIEAFTGGLRVASIYLPNGNPVDTEKYPYKLGFMERLHAHAAELLDGEDAFVLGGDYNAIPEPGDVYDAEAWEGDALYRPETRAAWRKIVYLGLTDAFRALNSGIGLYSFWDYQRGAWQKDNGIRIDHLMLSPQAADLLTASGIDRTPRGWEKPSDHTPVWCELDI
ncbi:MAG: exodeoxyribonuclease III [Rhodospirillaceae bacterium]|jgi:exodeoxyribonuclease III|nr:exodeoxyribonuclease III [Rhodospirillaceae bacterium]MBT4750115.1 exodeoxyribonuclease III [Rhodospirillaceae bacterium]